MSKDLSIVRDAINKKLTEMFGTGQPMEESRKIITDGVIQQIRRFNDGLSKDFMAMMQKERENMTREMNERMKRQQRDIMETFMREMQMAKDQMSEAHQKHRKEILQQRQEFMTELRTL